VIYTSILTKRGVAVVTTSRRTEHGTSKAHCERSIVGRAAKGGRGSRAKTGDRPECFVEYYIKALPQLSEPAFSVYAPWRAVARKRIDSLRGNSGLCAIAKAPTDFLETEASRRNSRDGPLSRFTRRTLPCTQKLHVNRLARKAPRSRKLARFVVDSSKFARKSAERSRFRQLWTLREQRVERDFDCGAR